jgi:hypothetical protein
MGLSSRAGVGAGGLACLLIVMSPLAGSAVSAPRLSPRAAAGSVNSGMRRVPDATSFAGALAAMRSAGSARAAGALWLASQRAALTSQALGGAGASAESGLDVVTGLECGLSSESGSGSVSSDSRAAAAYTRQLDQLLPAGNLDGQGGRDVLDYRVGVSGHSFRMAVTARDGDTGKALWSRVGATNALLAPFAARVGPARVPGVLLVTETIAGSGRSLAVMVSLRGISGSGTVLWSRRLTGQITLSTTGETLTDLPELAGLIHDKAGGVEDVLVGDANAASGLSSQGSVQPEVISSLDGSLQSRGGVLSSTTGIPEVEAVPDVSGDGLDDIAVVVPGKPGHLVTERGDTGAPIWTSGALPSSPFDDVGAVGPVTGGGAQDLVVSGLRDSFKGPSESVSLIRGSDGRVLWTHPADCVMPLQKAGRHLVGAVGLITTTEGGGRTSSTAKVVDTARSADGRVIYRKTYVASAHQLSGARSTSVEIEVSTVGDVQPDGSADIGLRMTATIGKKSETSRGVIDGRTGTLISEPSKYPTDGSLRHGRGTDLVRPRPTANGLSLTGYDGASGRQIFTTVLPGTRGLDDPVVGGLRITGHHCTDLAVSASSARKTVLGLFTATGEPRWTLAAKTSHLLGGHLKGHAVKGPDCV